MKKKFVEVETAIKMKLWGPLEHLSHKQNRANRVMVFVKFCRVKLDEQDLFIQLQQMQCIQLVNLQDYSERYCNVLPVFELNSAKSDIILVKSYLLLILVIEGDLEPTVIMRATQFVSVELDDFPLADIMNILGSATGFDVFLIAYKINETKRYFPYEWIDCTEKLNNKKLPSYTSSLAFCSTVSPWKGLQWLLERR